MTAKLSVNVNAIAFLRNRRKLPWPSVEHLGRIALAAGAYGLTVHPRPDERHIRKSDVPVLADLIRNEFPQAEYNIEGNPDANFVSLVENTAPDQVTLVPDDIRQVTSDHGWNIDAHRGFLTDVIARLKSGGMRVSLFIDPDPDLPFLAREVGADRVEIYTGPYGGAFDAETRQREFARVLATGEAASAARVGLNAGHDLTRENLPSLIEALPSILEVSIGHALIGDALEFGMAETVRLFRIACGDLS
ncbi:MAG: pyridoxine 5'-phosphate synthase [Hyphomicrobiales bacterium]